MNPLARTITAVGAACTVGLLVAACSAAASPASGPAHGGGGSGGFAGVPEPAHNGARLGTFGRNPSSAAQLVLSAQSIIYTADLTLRVKDVSAVATQVTTLVTSAGGYVSGEQEIIPHRNHATPLVTLTLKIPVSQYHQSLASLAKLGSQVSFGQHALDVTQRVADVASRVASAQAAIKQLRALLGKAGTVGALLQVQDEINNQEASLESLLAQQQALAHETSYGTVTVTLLGHHVVVVQKKKKKKASGFGTGLRAGWHALGVVVRALLTALGAALPFAVPIALLAGIGFAGRRRLARRRRPAADPPAPAAS
jgi:hypothetical protein